MMKGKKILVLVVSLILTVACVMTFKISKLVKADEDTGFEMVYGASIKVTSDGLRFRVQLDQAHYDKVVTNDAENKVEIYTYIAPVSEFEKITNGSYKDLGQKVGGKLPEDKLYRDGSTYYANVCITELYDGVNIEHCVMDWEFSAIAFIVDNTNATPEYEYSQFAKDENGERSLANTTRSQYQVVTSAILDLTEDRTTNILSTYQSWFATEEYPIVVKDTASYDALIDKINASNVFSGKAVKVNEGVKASEGKEITAEENKPTIKNEISLIFKNEGGTETVSTVKIVEGGTLAELPEAPEKSGDNTYTYTFDGWYDDATKISTETTFNESTTLIAKYNSVYKNYTVTFKDYNGNNISTKENYHYNDDLIVENHSESVEGYDYGWDKTLPEKVTEDATYTETKVAITYSAKVVRADSSEETIEFTVENKEEVLAGIQLTVDNVAKSYAWETALPNELALNNTQVFNEICTNHYQVTLSSIEDAVKTEPYSFDTATLGTESNGVAWIYVDEKSAKEESEVKYLRVKVSFSSFNTVSALFAYASAESSATKYKYSFGYRHGDADVLFYNDYSGGCIVGVQKYGGTAITSSSAKVYTVDNMVVDTTAQKTWTYYNTSYNFTAPNGKFATDTDYTFEFELKNCPGEMVLNFGNTSTIKEVVWTNDTLADTIYRPTNLSDVEKALTTNSTYMFSTTTLGTDNNGVAWLSVDEKSAKEQAGKKYLRVTVNFTSFNTFSAEFVYTAGASSYKYSFGYRHGLYNVFFYNDYQTTKCIAGIMQNGGGVKDSTSSVKVYDGDDIVFDTSTACWTYYANNGKFATGKDYVFEFALQKCSGNMALNFGAESIIKGVEWAEKSIEESNSNIATLSSVETVLASEESYTFDSSVLDVDSFGVAWLAVDDLSSQKTAGKKHLRITVNFTELNTMGCGVVYSAGNSFYKFSFGYKLGDTGFFFYNDYSNGCMGGAINAGGQPTGKGVMKIYQGENLLQDTTAGVWTYYVSKGKYVTGQDYIIDIDLDACNGDLLLNLGKTSVIKAIEWTE